MGDREYVRLTRARPRSAFGVVSISRSSLWLGKDHLLSVDTSGYTETYKRFYFRDVQAILVRQTNYWIVVGVVFAGAAALSAAVAIGSDNAIVAWVFGSLAGLCAAGLLFDLAAGPTCSAHLKTAVQVEALPSLSRVRQSRKVLARLRPLFAQAQGHLRPEDIAPGQQHPSSAGPASEPVAEAASEQPPTQPESEPARPDDQQ